MERARFRAHLVVLMGRSWDREGCRGERGVPPRMREAVCCAKARRHMGRKGRKSPGTEGASRECAHFLAPALGRP